MPARAKIKQNPISTNMLDVVVFACYLSYKGAICRRIVVWGLLLAKVQN
jgi:hypothetical protein